MNGICKPSRSFAVSSAGSVKTLLAPISIIHDMFVLLRIHFSFIVIAAGQRHLVVEHIGSF
jgi:hypothetical protein